MATWCGCRDENCDTCLEYVVPYCPPQLIYIPTTNLINLDVYKLWIKDKLGNIFTDTINTAPFGGQLRINTSSFPPGIFTPEFGALNLFLSTDDDGNDVFPLIVGGTSYNCIILSVDEPVYLTDDTGCFLLTDDDGNILIAQ